MSSQESVEESRVSHPAPRSMTNNNVNLFGPATEEEMEADLMRIDALEDQEVASRFRAGFTMGELQRSAIPNSVIPSNVRFLSYEKYEDECHLFSRSYATPLGARSFSRYREAS